MIYNKKSIGDYEIGELLYIQVNEKITPCLIIDIKFSHTISIKDDNKIINTGKTGAWFWPRQDFLRSSNHEIIPYYAFPTKDLGNCWQLLIGDKKAWLSFN